MVGIRGVALIASMVVTLAALMVQAAPHPASDKDEAAIAAAIASAKAIAAGALADAQQRIIGLEKAVGRRDAQGKVKPNAPPIEKYFFSFSEDQLYQYGRAVTEARKAHADVAVKMKIAIDLALDAYGIADTANRPTGPILSGPPRQLGKPGALPSYIGQKATFEPKLSLSLLDETGTFGNTGHNGVVQIEWGAFDYPGKLGMTLYHESLHFKELLTANVDILHEPRNETRQRRNEHLLWYRVFKLKKEDADKRAEIRAKFAADIARWDRLLTEGADPTTEAGMAALHFGSAVRPDDDPSRPAWMKPGLNDIIAGAETLERAIQAEVGERRERDAAAARERERLEDGRRLFASLAGFSRRFCESAADGVVPESMYEEFLIWRNGNYLAFSTEQPVVDLGHLGFTVDCPTLFENQILVARRKRYSHDIVTFDWAREVVREAYRRAHPSIPTLPAPTAPSSPPVGTPVETYPDDVAPRVPDIPHCRHHAWCRDN